ncbi:unnamed protein product [Caretta caretta]
MVNSIGRQSFQEKELEPGINAPHKGINYLSIYVHKCNNLTVGFKLVQLNYSLTYWGYSCEDDWREAAEGSRQELHSIGGMKYETNVALNSSLYH